jgi:hypothetical protein
MLMSRQVARRWAGYSGVTAHSRVMNREIGRKQGDLATSLWGGAHCCLFKGGLTVSLGGARHAVQFSSIQLTQVGRLCPTGWIIPIGLGPAFLTAIRIKSWVSIIFLALIEGC